jgi:hypothetical protein
MKLAAVGALVPAESTITMPSAFAMEFAVTAEFVAITESIFVSAPAATVVATLSAIIAATIEAMEPGPCTNKDAAVKIIRAVVAVRCARVGRIPEVAICADWCRLDEDWSSVDWPDSNSYSNPYLRMGCPRHNHEKPQKNCVL